MSGGTTGRSGTSRSGAAAPADTRPRAARRRRVWPDASPPGTRDSPAAEGGASGGSAQPGGRRTSRLGPAPEADRRPVQVRLLGCRPVLAPRRVLAALATPAVTRHARAAASRHAVFAVDPHRRQRRRHAFAVLVDERGELAQLGGLLEASPGGRPASQFAKSDWSSRNWVSGTVDRSRARNSASPMSGSSRTAPSFRAPAVVRRACARTPAACIHSPGCPSKPWGAGGRASV